METKNVKLYALDYSDAKTYLAASLFVLGNIALPQLFHLVPQGGVTWLPIYFFTLIGAYKFGWKVGLLTAVLSPVLNSWLFGMPLPAVLPAILLKSVLLAIAAGWT
ncbi:MAG: ECF transporter S component, partial [Bacteroides sp.]|nr:ECF transporter S component [Bacteroides sp.]